MVITFAYLQVNKSLIYLDAKFCNLEFWKKKEYKMP